LVHMPEQNKIDPIHRVRLAALGHPVKQKA
jgi:hypothetical protein